MDYKFDYSPSHISSKIIYLRGNYVIFDNDLAEIYGVPTSRLNEQVKRNLERFPVDFMFQLTAEEWLNLISQNAISRNHGGRRKLPYVFTEQGVAGLSGVLKSEQASRIHVSIMRAFVTMRKHIFTQSGIIQRIDILERKQLLSENQFEQILIAFEENTVNTNLKSNNGMVFFDGQVFDAYVFVNDLIKSANHSIILIDNYLDESSLMMLSKRKETCKAIIYTQKINAFLKLDLAKHNEQYPKIEIHQFKSAHDRFLIIDEKELYHIGASLKDLGKKWFAISKLNEFLPAVLEKLNNNNLFP